MHTTFFSKSPVFLNRTFGFSGSIPQRVGLEKCSSTSSENALKITEQRRKEDAHYFAGLQEGLVKSLSHIKKTVATPFKPLKSCELIAHLDALPTKDVTLEALNTDPLYLTNDNRPQNGGAVNFLYKCEGKLHGMWMFRQADKIFILSVDPLTLSDINPRTIDAESTRSMVSIQCNELLDFLSQSMSFLSRDNALSILDSLAPEIKPKVVQLSVKATLKAFEKLSDSNLSIVASRSSKYSSMDSIVIRTAIDGKDVCIELDRLSQSKTFWGAKMYQEGDSFSHAEDVPPAMLKALLSFDFVKKTIKKVREAIRRPKQNPLNYSLLGNGYMGFPEIQKLGFDKLGIRDIGIKRNTYGDITDILIKFSTHTEHLTDTSHNINFQNLKLERLYSDFKRLNLYFNSKLQKQWVDPASGLAVINLGARILELKAERAKQILAAVVKTMLKDDENQVRDICRKHRISATLESRLRQEAREIRRWALV